MGSFRSMKRDRPKSVSLIKGEGRLAGTGLKGCAVRMMSVLWISKSISQIRAKTHSLA